MKPTTSDRKYFFALRDTIHAKTVKDSAGLTKQEITDKIKHMADLTDTSVNDMTKDEFQMLKEAAKLLAYQIGLEVD